MSGAESLARFSPPGSAPPPYTPRGWGLGEEGRLTYFSPASRGSGLGCSPDKYPHDPLHTLHNALHNLCINHAILICLCRNMHGKYNLVSYPNRSDINLHFNYSLNYCFTHSWHNSIEYVRATIPYQPSSSGVPMSGIPSIFTVISLSSSLNMRLPVALSVLTAEFIASQGSLSCLIPFRRTLLAFE